MLFHTVPQPPEETEQGEAVPRVHTTKPAKNPGSQQMTPHDLRAGQEASIHTPMTPQKGRSN